MHDRLVYSTDSGRVQDKTASPTAPAGDGIVRIERDTKGRKGKGVSIVTGLGLDADALKELARDLKRKHGVGGSVRQWDIVLQTDQREKIKAQLEARGFTVKLAGG